MEDLAGTVLKGYDVEEMIGCGRLGAVYRARQISFGREVAIRFICPEQAARPEFIRRFEAEANVVARLEHPHIAPLHDFWRDPSGAYLVMRYLRGGSVLAALQHGSYELNAVALILGQVASALDFAHRQDVIHRNLKPGNILLDEDGNAYLADFAIAQAPFSTADALPEAPDYTAPEQRRGEVPTSRSDIYSLGLTLYELISGQRPPIRLPSAGRPADHGGDLEPSIPALPGPMSDALSAIVRKAAARNPEDRYRDAASLAVDFREAIGRVEPEAATMVEQLTIREQEVLARIAQGRSNHEIAESLVISIGTVKWHVNQLYKKLGVRGRVQAIVRARELDLIVGADASADLQAARGLAPAIDLPEPANPYKGLHAFQVTDARNFFGRDKLARRLIERMNEPDQFCRFLAVVGPSGSGKSSLVRAGLVPALWKGAIAGSETWFIVDMVPGVHPLDALESSLKRVASGRAGALRSALEQDEHGLIRVAALLLPADESELVIVVDQFEEVFTLVDSERERQHFLRLLQTSVSDASSRVRVVVTLRADYYDRPLHYPEFGELLRTRMETLLPLSVQELERAIRGPAERVGVAFEQGLVEQIVSAVNHQAGALPLLQYALTELFDRRTGRSLTHKAYQHIGGVVGALAARAEGIYCSLPDEAQALARQIFLRLVTLGEGAEDTRRRATQAELLSLSDNTDQIEEIIDQFAAYRLLALDRDPDTRQPTVEVAHEAILREWNRLRDWLHGSRADIRQSRAVARAAEEWELHDRDTSFLLRGARLEGAEKWLQETTLVLSPLDRAYIAACVEQRERETEAEASRKAREVRLEARSRRVLRTLAAVFALAAAIAGLLATEAQANFLRAERIRLAAQAQIALDNGEDVRIPALLALRSLRIGYSPEADAALLTAITRDIPQQRYEGHTGDGITGVYFSPDGSRILTTGTDGTARLWDTDSGAERQRFSGHGQIVHSAAFLPDGESVVTSGNDGTVRQWDIDTGREVARLLDEDTHNLKLALSPDGRLLATSDDAHRVRVWQIDTMALLQTLEGHTDLVNQIAFAPDGRTIATASFDATVRQWDVASGAEIRRLEGHAARVFGVAFSPDGSALASASDDSTVRLWNLQTGNELRRFFGTEGMMSVAFAPDGRALASGTLRGNFVTIWNTETGDTLREIRVTRSGVGFVAVSPDGTFVLSAGADNLPRLWHREEQGEPRVFFLPTSAIHAEAVIAAVLVNDDRQLVTVLGEGIVRVWDVATYQVERTFSVAHGSFVTDAIVGGRQRELLVASEDGIARLWNIADGTLIREFRGHDGRINSVALSPDDAQFVTGGSDGRVLLWNIDDPVPLRQFDSDSEAVTAVAISPDKRLLFVANEDGRTRLLDAGSGREAALTVRNDSAVRSAVFSPDGHYLLTGGDNSANLWDIETGERVRSFIGHTLPITVVGFDSEGRQVITGSQDKTVRLWDVEDGDGVVRQIVGHRQSLLSVAMSKRGDLLVTSDIGLAYVWRVELQDVVALACRLIPNDLTAEERRRYDIKDNDDACA